MHVLKRRMPYLPFLRLAFALCATSVGACSTGPDSPTTPQIDHHTHLLGPAAVNLLSNVGAVSTDATPFEAESLIQTMDSDGISCATVAGVGYFFASVLLPERLEDERKLLQQENSWIAAEAAKHPGRLIAFCGINPLRDYAEEEVVRCARTAATAGIKVHFANSGVDVLDEQHQARLVRILNTAAKHDLPVLVHTWVGGKDYGAEHAQAFIEHVLDASPQTVVQIAHLAGSGPGYDGDGAFKVYADAAAAGDTRLDNVWFDVATSITDGATQETLELIAQRLRTLGLDRVLFGSDYAGLMNVAPGAAWKTFKRLPLTAEEHSAVAANAAPYMRHGACRI